MSDRDPAIEALLEERREFPPPEEFAKQANVRDPSIYRTADRDFEKFWEDFARELAWYKDWKQVLEWKPPKAEWFVGGKLNASVNCLDRHVSGPRKNKAALIWEGEPGEQRVLTYRQLGHHRHVESDPISLADSQGLQDVAELRDLQKELAICEHPLLARLPFPDEGGLVLPGTRNVPVQAVH